MTVVWSYGGGTQSVAIAVLILQGRLPMPDIIVMADTSREISQTWEYLENIVRPAGFDVKVAGHDLSNVDLYSKNEKLLLPVFTSQDGHKAKLPTYCSNEWKRFVVMRWLRKVGVANCDVWLGISTDEAERMKATREKWYRHVYPLIEIVPMNRNQCVSLVEQYGWPSPPKSRCWMCPNTSPSGWRKLKRESPEDFEKAVYLDDEIRKNNPTVFLHELRTPLDQAVKESNRQSDMFDGCDSGYCWT